MAPILRSQTAKFKVFFANKPSAKNAEHVCRNSQQKLQKSAQLSSVGFNDRLDSLQDDLLLTGVKHPKLNTTTVMNNSTA